MANTTNFGWETPDDTDLVKDGASAMRTLGNSIDTSMADLKGGTSGQILSKNSATDMDFIWTTPNPGDITGVGVTSPLTGGGTSGDVTLGIQDASTTQKGAIQLTDSTSSTSTTTAATPNSVKSAYDLANTANTTANAAIPKSTVTTTGDVIYATDSAALTRLGIGTTGQVLTVSGGVPSWATPASGGGMTLISSTSLSGASVTVSSIPDTYKNIVVLLEKVYCNDNDYPINIRFNSDTSTNYTYNGIAWYSTAQGGGSTADTSWQPTRVKMRNASSTTLNVFGAFEIYNYTSTGSRYFEGNFFSADSGGTMSASFNTGNYKGSSAISSITLIAGGVNFSGGTMKVYGVN